jgi:putative ABC transport system permease protein
MLRKILVVFQFSLAVLLITGAIITSRQLNFMRGADLGFDKTNLLHIQLRGNLNQEYEMLREELMRGPGIISTCASMQPPFRIGSNSSGIHWEGKDEEMEILVSFTGVHHDFIKTMDIELQSGRDFSPDYPADILHDTLASFIINSKLAGIIGRQDILGMDLRFNGIHGKIVGIMEDYHFLPLSIDIQPMAVAPIPPDRLQHMIIRIGPESREASLRFIEDKWDELLPEYPLEYQFVEDVLDDMYRSEERMASLLSIFTIVAMIIASLGLFALASFTADRRIREIGIRKAFGAMESQISMMMIRDFSLYILISLAISFPAIWFIARWWLSEFHFRIRLTADLFIMTALITTAIAVFTVLYQSVKAARTHPVLALRYE